MKVLWCSVLQRREVIELLKGRKEPCSDGHMMMGFGCRSETEISQQGQLEGINDERQHSQSTPDKHHFLSVRTVLKFLEVHVSPRNLHSRSISSIW